VLIERKRRALRVHLSNVGVGLPILVRAIHDSLKR
jgi:hypothetical protein